MQKDRSVPPDPNRLSSADDQLECRATGVYAVVLLGGTGLMFGAMSYFVFVEGRQIWPMWMFWVLTVLAFVMALVDVRVLRIVISRESIHIRRAWGSRTMPLAHLREIRYVNFEYVVKGAEGSGLWFWIPMMISNKHQLIDRLQREIAANVVGQMSSLTQAQRDGVRGSLRDGAGGDGRR